MQSGSGMTPLATLLHATPALTHCNPIQTSSSSRLLLSDDCMCNPSHNMKIGWESRDSHFLLPHPISVTPTSNKKKSPLNQIVQFLKPQLRSQPQIIVLGRGGREERGAFKWEEMIRRWHCNKPSMGVKVSLMHSAIYGYATWNA